MAHRVIMPKQGLQMTEGTITQWLVKEGEHVKKEQPLFEMETDKLAITIDSAFDGVLLKIVRKEWETVPITETIAIIGTAGENIDSLLAETASEAISSANESNSNDPQKVAMSDSVPLQDKQKRSGTRILVSPRAKKLAEEKALDLSGLIGSGQDGMIVEKDVLPLLKMKATPLARKMAGTGILTAGTGTGPQGKLRVCDVVNQGHQAEMIQEDTIIPIAGMRRAISDNMMSSLHSMAQANHKIRVDMSEAVKIRESFKLRDETVSYNDIIVYMVSRVLMEMPQMNAVADDRIIRQKHYVNMGVAVAIENGLIVPTLRDSHRKSLLQIHEETAILAKRARIGELEKSDYSDGTFTITNLGMFGLDEFVAIINPPQVGILAVGAIIDTPVVDKGNIVIRPIMTLTLTYDHRAIDGAPAARFLQRVKEYLENPYLCLFAVHNDIPIAHSGGRS